MIGNNKLDQEFLKVEKALTRLGHIVTEPLDPEHFYIDASIHRFKYSMELFLRLLKILLASKNIEVFYPKDTLHAACTVGLIDNKYTWLDMLRDKNLTIHDYDTQITEALYENIKKYYSTLLATFKTLQAANNN